MPTGIADRHLDVRVDPLDPDLHPAAAIGELDGVRQEIPENLLQPLRVPGDLDDRPPFDFLRLASEHGGVGTAGEHVTQVAAAHHRERRAIDRCRKLVSASVLTGAPSSGVSRVMSATTGFL
jgi:hypothetical protein